MLLVMVLMDEMLKDALLIATEYVSGLNGVGLVCKKGISDCDFLNLVDLPPKKGLDVSIGVSRMICAEFLEYFTTLLYVDEEDFTLEMYENLIELAEDVLDIEFEV